MRIEKLVAAAATVFLACMGDAYANTMTFQGTYTVTYTAYSGSFGIDGNSPTITDQLLPNTSQNPFTEAVPVGGSLANLAFLTIAPAGSCGSNCGHYNNTASGTVNVSFTVWEMNKKNSAQTFSVSGTYSAKYSGAPLDCAKNDPASTHGQSDCIIWTQNANTVKFSDGAALTVTLNNYVDWNLQPPITFSAVPSPVVGSGLPSVLLALGAVGLLGWRRTRRLKVRVAA